MAAHNPTKPPIALPVSNVDRLSSARAELTAYEESLRENARIQDAGGIVVSHPKPPVDAAIELYKWQWIKKIELENRGDPVEHLEALELERGRRFALAVLADYKDPAYARRIELEITDGAPRAICIGGSGGAISSRAAPVIVKSVRYGEHQVVTQGCFHVFVEAGNHAGKRWQTLCPECKRLKPGRTAKRKLERTLRQLAAARRALTK